MTVGVGEPGARLMGEITTTPFCTLVIHALVLNVDPKALKSTKMFSVLKSSAKDEEIAREPGA